MTLDKVGTSSMGPVQSTSTAWYVDVKCRGVPLMRRSQDAYPQGFDCRNPSVWRPVTLNYHQYHETVNPSQPWYMPEFQGGSFDPWGGPGYDACAVLTGHEFQNVFYKQNWASNVKLISYYMLYGCVSKTLCLPHDVYVLLVAGLAGAASRSPGFTQGLWTSLSPFPHV